MLGNNCCTSDAGRIFNAANQLLIAFVRVAIFKDGYETNTNYSNLSQMPHSHSLLLGIGQYCDPLLKAAYISFLFQHLFLTIFYWINGASRLSKRWISFTKSCLLPYFSLRISS